MTSHALGRSFRRMGLVLASIAAFAIVVGTIVVSSSGVQAAGSFLLSDDFTHSTVTSTDYRIGGSAFTPCLTAAGGGSSTPGPCSPSIDSAGSGALRLTSAALAPNGQTGFLLYNRALPTGGGLDITFNMYQYGGTGADGIAFFLTNGQFDLSTAGASGGSLGYHNSTAGSGAGQPGIPNALLGIGFDAYGNFPAETNNSDCSLAGISTVRTPQAVSVRGPAGANARSGYCLLRSPTVVSDGIDAAGAGATRTQGLHQVRVVVDPPGDANPQVKVYLGARGDTGANAIPSTPLVTVPEPLQLQNASTFKFGWAAGTGGSTDIHEINTLTVNSVEVIPPTAALAATASATTVDRGVQSAATFTPSLQASGGPIPVNDDSVTVAVQHPDDVVLGAPPSGGPWMLDSSPTAEKTVYRFTAATAVSPGAALPSLTVPVSSDDAGKYTLTGVVDDGHDTASVGDRTATVSFSVRPTVTAVSGTGIADATDPAVVALQPAAPGGGSSATYSLATQPDSSKGTATIDATSGAISFTPKAGASGTSTFTYAATIGGVQSQPAAATVDIVPAIVDQSVTTPYATTVSIPLSTGAAGTGLHYVVTTPAPAGEATATISGNALSVLPADGFSGLTHIGYSAIDADGLASAPRTVTVAVKPLADPDSLELSLDSHGIGTVTGQLAPPSGTGPFDYLLETSPEHGTLAIDSTGGMHYQAESGTPGSFTAGYRVIGADGVTSDPTDIAITVRPYTSTLEGNGVADGGPIVLDAPITVGATPIYRLASSPDAALGSAAIDPSTGVITFTPAAGASGVATFDYVATVAGVDSPARPVTVDVTPVMTPVNAGTAYAAPVAIDLNPAATGSGLTFAVIASPGDKGTVTGDIASGRFTFTPVDGFSGDADFTVQATDGDGLQSTVVTVKVTVTPAAAASSPVVSLPTNGDDPLTFPVPDPSGTGPFHYEIVPGSFPDGAGDLSIDPDTGEVTFTPAPGVSGVFEAQYRVTDGSGTTSPDQVITLTVRPSAPPAGVAADLGDGDLTVPAPQVQGTGPFDFAIDDAPDPTLGTATIDPDTGEIVVTPADPDWSGTITLSYVVTDSASVTSEPIEVTVTVRPKVGPISADLAGADASSGTTFVPKPSGTAPFEFRIVGQPEHGTATITDKGILVVPDPGYSGTLVVRFVAVDASGVESLVQTATLEVGALAFTGVGLTDTLMLGAVGLLGLGAALLLVMLGVRRRRGAHAG